MEFNDVIAGFVAMMARLGVLTPVDPNLLHFPYQAAG